jgi:hypothetical protein
MKKYLLLFAIIIISNLAIAQNKTSQIEIEPYLRWDTYPQFTNAINNIATYKIDIKGNSWGVNGAYEVPIANNLLVKIGVGFFKYSFNKIKSSNVTFGNGNGRVINYPTTLGIVLITDRYQYNTFSLNLGVEKVFEIKKDLFITNSINFLNYFTYSQEYHLPFDNSFISQPDLKIKNDYKIKNNRYFGLGANFQVGLLKKIGKINIGPSLIIPIYDKWKQDNVFPTEINFENRNKWLNGIGAGIICNYSLNKIKKHAK